MFLSLVISVFPLLNVDQPIPPRLTSPNSEDVTKRVQSLIERLSSPAYREREEASRQLVKIGPDAAGLIAEGRLHPNPEVSARCDQIFPLVELAFYTRLIAQFESDPDNPPPGLPAFKQFRKVAGESKEATQLYIRFIKEHRTELIEVAAGGDRGHNAFIDHVTKISQLTRTKAGSIADRKNAVELGDIAFMLFLGGLDECRSEPKKRGPGAAVGLTSMISVYASYTLDSDALRKKLTSETEGEPYRNLFYAWLERETYISSIRKGVQLIQDTKLKDGVPTLIRLSQNSPTPSTRGYALVGLIGSLEAKHVAEVEILLDDKASVGTLFAGGVAPNNRREAQVRDVALAAIITYHGLELKDYGFDGLPNGKFPGSLLTAAYYGFPSDEARAESRKKFDEWLKANPKKK